MSAFSAPIKTADRLVEYLGAVTRHGWFLWVGIFLTFLPTVEKLWFTSPAANADLDFFIQRVSWPVGLVLVFVATFRAWNEQKEIADKAAPEALQAEVEALKAHLVTLQTERETRWERWTEKQEANFVAVLKEVPIRTEPHIVYIFRNPLYIDCRELADLLADVLGRAKWSGSVFQSVSYRQDLLPASGIELCKRSVDTPEFLALKCAFDKIGLSYVVAATARNDDVPEIRIGPRKKL